MGRMNLHRLIPLACLLALALALVGCGGTAGRTTTPGALIGGADSAAPESISAPNIGNNAVPQATDMAVPDAAEIAALPAPDGVAADVWATLTDELNRVLAEYRSNGKRASAPPTGDAGVVELSYYEPTSTLRWLYTNLGDYDQNGIVGVSDLTPLGVHFGEESPDGAGQPFPLESLGTAIDGNGDGLIGVGDITPIGQNFGVRVEGYNLYVATSASAHPPKPDLPNAAGTTWLGEIQLNEGDSTAGRLRFYHQVVPTQAEQYYWVRPYDSADDGAASNSVHVTLPPPQAPIASLKITGNTKTLAHIVWDATGSLDPDGEIVKYEWDFNGDGVFEYDSGSEAKIDFYYYEAGTYGCSVQVTDGDAKTDVDSKSVQVTEEAKWHNTVADVRLDFIYSPPHSYPGIEYEQLLEVEGRPTLVYSRLLDDYDPETGFYYTGAYLRAGDEYGENWPGPQFIPDSGGAGSALVVNGLPAMLLGFSEQHQSPPAPYAFECWKYYIRAADADGTSWPTRKVVSHYSYNSPLDWEGTWLNATLAFVLAEGAPAILGLGYDHDGQYRSVFIRANNSQGTSWPGEISYLSTSIQGNIQVGTVNERVAFLRRENSDDILYNLALGPMLDTWAEPELVDRLEVAGEHFWLLDTDGIPAAVYYEDLLSSLKYRRALDADGSAWGEPVVLSTTAGSHNRAAVVDGRPTVLYNDRIEDDVKMVAANDDEGTLWGSPSSVPEYPWRDPWPNVENTPFAGVAGQPAFIYTARHSLEGDEHETELHYVAYY